MIKILNNYHHNC